jgi:hypothetical protein
MVGENTKEKIKPLLPLRHEQGDLFVCDIFDAVPKGDVASMEHPLFSLSTKPDHRVRRYETSDNKRYIEVRPGYSGLVTVHDRDVLIYCISQVMAALNKGRPVYKTLRFKAYDLLVSTNRNTDGRGYQQLKAAFERLQGTQVVTNIITGGVEQTDIFSLVDRARVMKETHDGRMLDVEITLSDWVFNAIENSEVLTLNHQYFRLRKPLERRLYEIARKHCGKQKHWKIALDLLQEKTGSNSSKKEFRRLVKGIAKADEDHNHMPDYCFRLEDNCLIVSPKTDFSKLYHDDSASTATNLDFVLKTDTYEKAKQYAPGMDIYSIEQEWREWLVERPRLPDLAFIGFVKKWVEKHGSA